MKDEDKEKLIIQEDSDDEEPTVKHEKTGVNYGVPLILCSAFFYSLSSLTVKLMLDVDPMELLMFRYLGLFLFSLPITIYEKKTLFPLNLRANLCLWIHSVAGAAGGMFSFYAFRHMPLGDASSLCFSTPLFVALLSVIFLREKCSLFTWLVVTMTFCGVVLIAKPESIFGMPTSHTVELWGVFAGIMAAFCKANSFISLRLCDSLHFSVVVCHFGLIGSISSVIHPVFTNQFCIPSLLLGRLSLLGLSLLGFLGQLFLTIASKMEKPSTMSVCRSTDILFAFSYEIFIFHHIPDIFSLIGAILIVTSVFLIKRISNKK